MLSNAYDLIARQLLRDTPPPDLRRLIVLLPNYQVAPLLAKSLAAASGTSALLLPQFLTFTDWAQPITLAETPQSDHARQVTLYQALRHRDWFPQADRWTLAQELLGLIDELTRQHIALPADQAEFIAQLESAYQARRNQALQFEAQVVHELWRVMTASGKLDTVSAYQRRLAQRAQLAAAPLVVLQSCDLSTPEQRCLNAYAERAQVTCFDLRQLDLPPHAPRLLPAHGLEQEAQAADLQVRRWLLDGKQHIAIVAQDRLVARRVRALLERAQILVQDETGWTFSTLAVSTVLMRWLEALQSNFYYSDLLDLLKSPFLFADQPASERKQAVYQLERLLREHQITARLDEFLRLADTPEVRHALLRLQQAAYSLALHKSLTLSDWLARLEQSLDSLGMVAGLAQDEAGRQLLQLLAGWCTDLADDDSRFSFDEWRSWLRLQLDQQTFRDTRVSSPVVLTHLAATRWRSFDAVLLLGCDAAHLPGDVSGGNWFNDAVRGALGLPVTASKVRQIRDDLNGLFSLNDTLLATWQHSRNGEPNALSPWLQLLNAGRIADGLASLIEMMPVPLAQLAPPPAPLPSPSVMPSPAAPADLLPSHISPSGYGQLVACPYRYFAKYILRLNELDEIRESLDKRDYGTWVHQILQQFHLQVPAVSACPAEQAAAQLSEISERVFSDAIQHDYLAHGWRLRWQAQQAHYLDWQRENEAAGWLFDEAEREVSLDVDAPLTLAGKVDRIDRHAELGWQIFDYKTKDANRLKQSLAEPGEEVQLASYAAAYSACAATNPAGAAAFVALDNGEKAIISVHPEQAIAELAAANLVRLKTVFGQLRQGVPLPANGSETVCEHCEMGGLCRRAYWSESE